MTTSRPTGSQVVIQSSRTGTRSLDQYIEDAELGNRTIADLLSTIFDSYGNIRSDFAEFRLTTNNTLQVRFGQHLDEEEAWQTTPIHLLSDAGTWTPNTQYAPLTLLTHNNNRYLTKTSFISGNTFDASPLTLIYDDTASQAAISAAQAAASSANTQATSAATSAFNAQASATTASNHKADAETAAALATSQADAAQDNAILAQSHANDAQVQAQASAQSATQSAGYATQSLQHAQTSESSRTAAEAAAQAANNYLTLVTNQLYAAIYISNTPPTNPTENMLWLDIS